MEKHRLWVIASVMAIVAVVGLGFLLGVQPQLTALSAAESELAAVEANNAAAEAKLAALKVEFERIDELQVELTDLVQSVPTGANAPELVDQLDGLAKNGGLALIAITVADAQPYATVGEAVVALAEPEPGVASTDSSMTPPAPAQVQPGAPPITNALITPDNFAVLEVQVRVKGSYAQVLDYVNGLQSGPRLFLVTALTTTPPDESTGLVEATIGGLVYAALTPDLTTTAG